MYVLNSSNPRLASLFPEVGSLTKLHGLPIPPTGSFTIFVTFYFPFSFPLAGKFRVVPVFHLFFRFFMLGITPIVAFSKLCLELFDGAKILLTLVS